MSEQLVLFSAWLYERSKLDRLFAPLVRRSESTSSERKLAEVEGAIIAESFSDTRLPSFFMTMTIH